MNIRICAYIVRLVFYIVEEATTCFRSEATATAVAMVSIGNFQNRNNVQYTLDTSEIYFCLSTLHFVSLSLGPSA